MGHSEEWEGAIPPLFPRVFFFLRWSAQYIHMLSCLGAVGFGLTGWGPGIMQGGISVSQNLCAICSVFLRIRTGVR